MRASSTAVVLVILHVACQEPSHVESAHVDRVDPIYDPDHALGAVVLSDEGGKQPLTTGPLFLTDVIFEFGSAELTTSSDPTCDSYKPLISGIDGAGIKRTDTHHGMHLFIPKGTTLCYIAIGSPNKLIWAGFRP